MDKYGTGADPYIDPATGVLRNKLGIEDEKQFWNQDQP
jgi:fido (protein-threonine AMPylation protein)